MATRLELQNRVQANLGRVGVTTAENTAVQTWIDQAIREDICADHNWSGMEFTRTRTLTADTDTYAFANATVFKDCRWIMLRRTSGEDYFMLEEVTLDELVDPMRFTEQTTNMPRVWARDGDSYVLRPIPDDTYAVRERVYEYPSSLSGDSSTNFATLYLPKLVEIAATRYGYMYYGEAESFQLWSQLYSAELAKAVGVDRRRLSPSRPTMKPGTGAGALESGYPSGYGSSYAPYSWL
jgi:hypothetical protein